jgi:hypothetical protein
MKIVNRVLWALVGLVLLAAGVVGTLISLGRFPWVRSTSVLLGPGAADRWRSAGNWAFVVTIAVGLVIALLGVLLLRAQLRRRYRTTLPDLVSLDSDPGRTRVDATTLDHALTLDLESHPRVRRVAAHLVGEAQDPAVTLRLVVAPDANVSDLRNHVDRALDRFGHTAGLRPRLDTVEVKVLSGEPSRVTGRPAPSGRHRPSRVGD